MGGSVGDIVAKEWHEKRSIGTKVKIYCLVELIYDIYGSITAAL